MLLETIKTRLISGYIYLMDLDGERVEREVYHVNHDGTVQTSIPGSGLVDRKHPVPRERFEPITCINPPAKCADARCGNVANSVRYKMYCVDCASNRF